MNTGIVLYEVARQKISDQLQGAELRQRKHEVGMKRESGAFEGIRRSIGEILIAIGERISGNSGHPDVKLSGLS